MRGETQDRPRSIPTPATTDHGDWSSSSPCCVCGKHTEARYWVVMGAGNTRLFHPEDEALAMAEHGDVGGQPIGSTCRRKVPAEYVVDGGAA